MTKRALVLLLLVALLLGFTAQAPAATWYVRQGGSDLADGRKPASAFASVTQAARVLDHGDQVIIGPGTYRGTACFTERFGSDKNPIRILGDESGQQSGDPAGPVVLLSDGRQGAPALLLSRLSYLEISGLTFHSADTSGGEGLLLEHCRNVLIEKCSFEALVRGATIRDGRNSVLRSSVFYRCTLALSLQGCVDSAIAHCTIASSSSAAILVLASGGGTIGNCLLANNNTAMVLDAASAAGFSSDHNAVEGPIGPWGDVPTVANIFEWYAASGQERNSSYVLPAFVDPAQGDLHIDPQVNWAGGLPGQAVGRELPATAGGDRDGKPLIVGKRIGVGAYAYPQPQAGVWKKLDAKLPAGGPRQSAALFNKQGTMLRSLLADACGVTELWWDGRNDEGWPAPPGDYQVRSAAHDIRLLDDGNFGDNGNARSVYNPDNADHVAVLPDGGFAVLATYDEASMTFRRFDASGQGLAGCAPIAKDFWGICVRGGSTLVGMGKGAQAQLATMSFDGAREMVLPGKMSLPILAQGEGAKDLLPGGLAMAGGHAYVSLSALNLVRVIDMTTGQKVRDVAVPSPGDLAADPDGGVWVTSGADLLLIDSSGTIARKVTTPLAKVWYLAVNAQHLLAVDRHDCRIAVLQRSDGKLLKQAGQDRSKEYFLKTGPEVFRDPRGAAFLPDGRAVLTEHARMRIFDPLTLTVSQQILSNFMDTAVAHPVDKQYVYCGLGAFQVDPVTGAWQWLVETPPPAFVRTPETDTWKNKWTGGPSVAVRLDKRSFIAHFAAGALYMVDVTEPLAPRIALACTDQKDTLGAWAYTTIGFNRRGDIIAGLQYTLAFRRIPFLGLDNQGVPRYDFANPVELGLKQDPTPRKVRHIGSLSCDPSNDDIYYLGVDEKHNKMVPGWGADGTGVGRSSADGTPLWFALSSGGNYSAMAAGHDGKNSFALAAKSFGGQVDVFDRDGLRLTTGNWGYLTHYQIGFVDLRYGITAYTRPDGKLGLYIEDDAIGRFGRYRMDGGQTLQRRSDDIRWQTATADAAGTPSADKVASSRALAKGALLAKIAPLPVDGDWSKWQQAGIAPQIVALPSSVGFKRVVPDDLLTTFRAGTYVGAVARDDAHYYVYFLVSDDTLHFEATDPATMWMYDGVELWLEEEQFGLALTADGAPRLFKYRYHDRAGKEWSANYELPRELVWGKVISDLSSHPLGNMLATLTGVSFQGKSGYAMMAKIPFDEVKLVGGLPAVPGREGTTILPTKGMTGEVLRIAVALDGVSASGRAQDYQVDWPVGRMFADPTRSYPFVLAP